MKISKMCLKQSLSHSKWVLQVILSLTVLSNCVLGRSNFDTDFLPDCTKFCVVFLSVDRKFNEDFRNVLKTVIFSLQVPFIGNFVLDYLVKLCFLHFKV